MVVVKIGVDGGGEDLENIIKMHYKHNIFTVYSCIGHCRILLLDIPSTYLRHTIIFILIKGPRCRFMYKNNTVPIIN